MQRQDWESAIVAFKQVERVDPNYKDISEKLLAAQNNLNNPPVAEASEKSLENKKSSKKETRNWIFIGDFLSVLLIPIGVAFFMVLTTRAKWVWIQGNYQKAALIYESILMNKPNKVKLYPSLANIYSLLNRNDETARKVYDTVLQMDINPQLRQKLDELTNQKYLSPTEIDDVEGLEEQLRRELNEFR
jgi:tetratricopeptide (TPR) repeat protein